MPDRRLLRAVTFRDVLPSLGAISFVPDGSRAIVAAGGLLRVIDTGDFRVLEAAPLASAGAVVFAPDGSRGYILRWAENDLAVLELSPQPCAAAPGVRAHWPGDGSADDAVNSYDGVLKNGAGFAPGRVGQAFSFTGNGMHVEIPRFDEGALDFTVSAWVKFRETAGTGLEATIIEKTGSGPEREDWRLAKTADNRLVFCEGSRDGHSCDSNKSVLSTTRVTPELWYFVAASKTQDALSMYVDGRLENTTHTAADGRGGGVSSLRIGADHSGGRMLRGLVDEVQVNLPALPADALHAMYEAGTHGDCLHPIPDQH